MLVCQTFRRKSSDGKIWWGNNTIASFLKEFPKLGPLVKTLQREKSWSRPRGREKRYWSALFYVDYAIDPPEVRLEMKVPSNTTEIPELRLEMDALPSLRDVERYVLSVIR
ncbi:MAG: hypothetical protein Q8Q97_02240 [bacterium]|nr:hypothetical protein [bacterium]